MNPALSRSSTSESNRTGEGEMPIEQPQNQMKEKTMKKLKSLGMAVMLTTAAAGFVGCAGNRYEQSTGERIDDTATTGRVKSELGKDSVYKYPDVKVSTFK